MHLQTIEKYLQDVNTEIINSMLNILIFLFIFGGALTTILLLLSYFIKDFFFPFMLFSFYF